MISAYVEELLVVVSFLSVAQPPSHEEEEASVRLLAAVVVCVPGLVPAAVHQRSVHVLHLAVRLPVRQTQVHQVGHVPGTLPVPEHLYSAASQGGHSTSEPEFTENAALHVGLGGRRVKAFRGNVVCFCQRLSVLQSFSPCC